MFSHITMLLPFLPNIITILKIKVPNTINFHKIYGIKVPLAHRHQWWIHLGNVNWQVKDSASKTRLLLEKACLGCLIVHVSQEKRLSLFVNFPTCIMLTFALHLTSFYKFSLLLWLGAYCCPDSLHSFYLQQERVAFWTCFSNCSPCTFLFFLSHWNLHFTNFHSQHLRWSWYNFPNYLYIPYIHHTLLFHIILLCYFSSRP